MFVELIILLLTSIFIWDYTKKKHRYDLLNKFSIPGPKVLPILGSALELRGVTPLNSMAFTRLFRAKYGKVFQFWVLHQLAVVVMDVKYLETVLSSQQMIKKSTLYGFLECWLGDGLLLSDGSKWHTRRKIITPTFHFKILEEFVEVFDQQSSVMVKKLQTMADGKTPVNIFPIVCLTALDIIAETAMGVKVYAQETSDVEYVKAVDYVSYAMGNRFSNPAQRTDWLFRLTSPKKYREVMDNIKVLHNFTDKVIGDRRSTLEKSIADGAYQSVNASDETGVKKRVAFLDMLLQARVDGKPLSNADIREEVDTFMFEGHDTTTSGVSYCIYLISRHPEVQRRCIEEIHSVIGEDKDAPVTQAQLQQLHYLECVIKETMRLYPPVPAISRHLTEDTAIGDIILPGNTNVSIPFFMIFRDPDYFSDPDEFKPERFFTDSSEKINPFAYVPFSAGPRNCIGQKFAMLEMKSTVSKVLRHFELLPLGRDVEQMFYLIIKSATGVNVGFKPRN